MPRVVFEQADGEANVSQGTVRRSLSTEHRENGEFGKWWRDFAADNFDPLLQEAEPKEKETGKQKKRYIRTCSTKLADIFGDDLPENTKQVFLHKTSSTAIICTDYISELSPIVRGTTLTYASSLIQLDHKSKTARVVSGKAQDMFDVKKVFPHKGCIRDKTALCSGGIIPVTPSPAYLGEYIDSISRNKNGDFTKLFSEAHLQVLHSQFFGKILVFE